MPEDCMCANGSPYFIKVRAADPTKVAVVLGSGEVCWDEATCLLQPRNTYDNMSFWGDYGIFDFSNQKNPFADYSFVFIPNCTFDTLVGNKSVTHGRVGTIHHKGSINVARSVEWAANRFPSAENIVVIGTSSGTHRSAVAAGKLAESLPAATVRLFLDSPGPVSEELVALQLGSFWSDLEVDRPWPEWPTDWSQMTTATQLQIVAARFPDIRIAQFNFAGDTTNIRYLDLVGLPLRDMKRILLEVEQDMENAGNPFAMWLHPGSQHIATNGDEFFELQQDGVFFTDWLRDFIDGKEVEDRICQQCDG